MRKVGRLAGNFVCVSQALESLTNRTRQHGKLGAALLLLQDNQRLVKVRIAAQRSQVLLQTPASNLECCGSRKKPAERPPSNFAFLPVRRCGDSPGICFPSIATRPEVSGDIAIVSRRMAQLGDEY